MAASALTLTTAAGMNLNEGPDAVARRLARGDPEKGVPPDERFAALLETPPAANASAAVAIYQRRMHAKLVSFLRTL